MLANWLEAITTIEDDVEVNWDLARCRDGAGTMTGLFFSEQIDDIARAKAICKSCSVREPCLAYAVRIREPHGIWGGLNEVERKQIAAQRAN